MVYYQNGNGLLGLFTKTLRLGVKKGLAMSVRNLNSKETRMRAKRRQRQRRDVKWNRYRLIPITFISHIPRPPVPISVVKLEPAVSAPVAIEPHGLAATEGLGDTALSQALAEAITDKNCSAAEGRVTSETQVAHNTEVSEALDEIQSELVPIAQPVERPGLFQWFTNWLDRVLS